MQTVYLIKRYYNDYESFDDSFYLYDSLDKAKRKFKLLIREIKNSVKENFPKDFFIETSEDLFWKIEEEGAGIQSFSLAIQPITLR